MTRTKASLINMALLSVLLVALVFIVVNVWYPGLTFRISGALKALLMIIGISVAVGPLVTLIVYKQGKAGMTFDLIVIALLQMAVLGWGAYALYKERPGYLVFAVDRFNLVAQLDIDSSQLPTNLKPEVSGVPVMVFARMPEDPDEFQAFLQSVMFYGQPDLERRTEFWEPYANGARRIVEALIDIDDFEAKSARESSIVIKARENHAGEHPNVALLPIGVVDKDITMLVDRDTLEPIAVLDVDAWGEGEDVTELD